jgi:O-antigen ligase/polysaccharide polymerase Wzy-like membrane protein
VAIAPPTQPGVRPAAALRGRLARARVGPQAAAALLGFAVLASVGLADGGLFPRTWRLGALALFAVAAAALLARGRIAVRRLEWAALTALAAFAGWIGLSVAWSGNASEAERALLYVAAVFAVLVVAERASVLFLLGGALAGITVVTAYGLSIYLFTSPPPDRFEGSLLYQPLGYANALGIFDAIGVLLAVGIALALRRPLARAAALLPLLVLVPALLLTSSRGAWVAAAVGFAAMALSSGPRVGRRALAFVALGALAAGTAVVVTTGEIAGFVTENRIRYWKVAWADYRDHPVLGSGSGTFGDYWLAHGPGPGFTRTAHSLYLQSLAELGPLGLVLVLTVVAVPLLALRGRRDSVVGAAAAGYVAYVVHAGMDWDWEMPAVTLAGLFCGAAVLVATRPDVVPPLRPPARIALAVLALAFTALTATFVQTEGTLPFG